MEGRFEYIKYAVVEGREGVILQLWVSVRDHNFHITDVIQGLHG
jgi:hypothetical protein